MHDHWYAELARKLLSRREMIRVSMGIDKIPDAQTIFCGQRQVTIDLTELRVDQRGGAGLLAAYDVGAASASDHCFEFHWELRKLHVILITGE
jgi:hypothetical protein